MKKSAENGQEQNDNEDEEACDDKKSATWKITPWKPPDGEDEEDERYNQEHDNLEMASDKEGGQGTNPPPNPRATKKSERDN